ncbi:hypothetical protein Poli38472_013734 [Pythium oligandrum]|uniref:Guanylate cyclase domain-containing protein n=1 Tax=Pythium oligandrum TaxID=41045 RepID=A0A8K1CEA0_PYTOL|nr:hypothetical protein Poli38472_013734 [Pythium oligandrum]|eukprot:TMW61271.1 hypothetical protein Poli38472_013734 [Pythium oligandrum]
MLHLRFRWDVHVSSVRWLFWLFFLYLWLWSTLRSVYSLWLSTVPAQDLNHDVLGENDTKTGDLDALYARLKTREIQTTWLTVVFVAGDIALLGITATLFPLVYELARIARTLMDRGAELERQQTNLYMWCIHGFLMAFGTTEVTIAAVNGGYSSATQQCLVLIYVVQFCGLAYMIGWVIKIKRNGRQFETIHGAFVKSPVYQRLKRIMTVYVLFSFQFQLASVIVYIADPSKYPAVLIYVGVSRLLYGATGLALSITTSCSQACVLTAFSHCLPDDFEAEFSQRRLGRFPTAPMDEDLEAPINDPVFVFTDIESSSALWGIANGAIMSQATEIHDNILRSTLPKYRGYEITTCGDAFQLAFHRIRDAVEYCMDVQLQLLMAKWPKELHGAIPATQRRHFGHRRIFNGLRVRMGIHDASEIEGRLIQDVHAVTGKTMYTGASEVTAQFVGDLGSGGQILVTGRVAAWLKYRLDDLSVDFVVERVGFYTVPQVNLSVDVHQIQPLVLAERMRDFPTPEQGRTRQHQLRPIWWSFSQLSAPESPKSTPYVSIDMIGSRTM